MRCVLVGVAQVGLLTAACTANLAPTPAAPTVIPFPTMTVGSRVDGQLPPAPPAFAELLANPATAVAAASLPTATPNYTECPAPNDSASLGVSTSMPNTILAYLNDGGTALESELQASPDVTNVGVVQDTFDLTGEGTPEVMVAYSSAGQGGTMLVLTCESGRYALSYQNTAIEGTPQVLRVGDMNNDTVPDVLFTSETCSEDDGLCLFRTVMISWQASEGRFTNLMNLDPDGDTPPTFVDVDSDNVLEVVTQQQGGGTSATGPLRTGTRIYDWNGETYVLSVSQPNPIRYLIQAVHEGDRAFREERMADAARLYLYAYEEGVDELSYWYGGGERDVLSTYLLYRILLTFTFAENGDPLSVFEEARNAYPNLEEAPVYAQMTDIFWTTYQESNNLNVACQVVLEFVNTRPDALDLLNRYGTRNPTYTAQNLCPF